MKGRRWKLTERQKRGTTAAEAEQARPFFFQAEDGIRDGRVTGVQTCALPICDKPVEAAAGRVQQALVATPGVASATPPIPVERSEERRVGKECRSRWSADHYRKKGKAWHMMGKPSRGAGDVESASQLCME